MLEVHDCGPVVRLVLLEPARGARCDIREVEGGIHREIEAVVRRSLIGGCPTMQRRGTYAFCGAVESQS